jgi:hypothetical protein
MVQTFYTTELTTLYGSKIASQVEVRLHNLIQHYHGRVPTAPEINLTERDSILITYADQVRQPGVPHLKTARIDCLGLFKASIFCLFSHGHRMTASL